MDVSDAKRLRSLEDENRKLKKLLAESMLDQAALKELLTKFCVVRPGVARSFVLPSEAACVNVSGLSRACCCCSQAFLHAEAHLGFQRLTDVVQWRNDNFPSSMPPLV
jgi:hypothetical protein